MIHKWNKLLNTNETKWDKHTEIYKHTRRKHTSDLDVGDLVWWPAFTSYFILQNFRFSFEILKLPQLPSLIWTILKIFELNFIRAIKTRPSISNVYPPNIGRMNISGMENLSVNHGAFFFLKTMIVAICSHFLTIFEKPWF